MKLKIGLRVCIKPINCLLSNKSVNENHGGIGIGLYEEFLDKILTVSESTIYRDMHYIKLKNTKYRINSYLNEESIDLNTKI